MGSPAFDVDALGPSAGARLPQPGDPFEGMALLPSRLQRAARKRVIAGNEIALYVNLHIALQRFQQLLERGSKTVAAVNALGSSADDLVISDSFDKVRTYMSGSVPQSFPSALARAWPANEGYGGHPDWWASHLPKRQTYSLPTKLVAALKGAEPGASGLTTALQQYYSPAASGIQAEQQRRLAQAKRSLELAVEMVLFQDPQIRSRVDAIRSTTVQLLDWTVTQASSDEFEVAVRIATDYLPHTLQSYLDVPADHVPIGIGGGKSARDLTLDQLDLISKALQGASNNHATNEASDLLANQRFLESRFGGSSLDLPT